MSAYNYVKQTHLTLLTKEIQESSIVTALERVEYSVDTTTVVFKAALSPTDETTLTTIINAHNPANYVPEQETIYTEFTRIEDDEHIPYVYASARPMNHYNYFTSAGDGAYNSGGATYQEQQQYGKGNRVIFDMLDTDVSKTIDVTFNEVVYLKDGMIFSKNAPFGAMVDIDVFHPLAGYLLSFGKGVPIHSDFPISMDTEDRAVLPIGLILRFTCYNATGLNGQDAPAAFKVLGRLEMYRPKPPGT